MNGEVRIHMLRPAQIEARRKEAAVAYIPLGTLEWHGLYNPLGADALQAEGIAVRCAEIGGGLAFPPLYYGESRAEGLMEVHSEDRTAIAEALGLPPDAFSPAFQPFSPMEQVQRYQGLLLHILAEAESLGFEVGVLVAGHYPLIDHARAAALLHNQRRGIRPNRLLAWAFADHLLLEPHYECAGDHAGGWETSHLLALHPRTVDPGSIPPKGDRLIGAGGRMHPSDATAAFGLETIDRAAELAVKEVRHRLDHPEAYRANGTTLSEGRWR